MDLMVSVIVLTYNHKDYIRRALDSILEQQVSFDYEVIIGDDASKDGTDHIINEYVKRYPKLVHAVINKTNLGGAKNAFQVLNMAKGKYLATCEGDDYWTDKDKLQKQVTFLEDNPQYSGCVHPINIVDEHGDLMPRKKLQWISDRKEFSILDFDGVTLPGHAVSVVRKNFMLDPDFDKEFIYKANPYIVDRTVTLLWLARGNYYRLDDKMASYRIRHNGNATTIRYSKNTRRFSDDYEYTKTLEEYAQKVLQVKVNFDKHKRDLFAKACIYSVLHLSSKERELPQRIIAENGRPMWYCFGIFVFAYKQVLYRLGGC